MKRLILTLATAATLAAPVIASADDRGGYDRDRRGDRSEYRDDRRDGRWDDRRGGRSEYRDDRRDDHRGRKADRWDRGRHNGYYYQNRWYYGPPPVAYYDSPYFRPGYTGWSRGAILPPYYRGYVVSDYHRHHLRRPPRGYVWYRVGDDYLLAAIATGLIFEIITH
jgi:Ni/Co efflux regulator RcnB